MGHAQEIVYGSNHGRYLTVSNTKIYFEEYGKGSPLLLLHGGFGSIQDFQKVIPTLSKHFKVLAVDSPGHGRSEQADSLSFELMADYFSDIIDQLKLDRVNIIGFSDGGITALLLAAKRPDKIKKIIVSGSNSRMDGLKPEVLDYLKIINPAFIQTHQKEWLEDYKNKSPEKEKWEKFVIDIAHMYSRSELIDEETLSKISAKVLLVFGDNDVVKLEHGIELNTKIRGSDFCVLPNTSHYVFNEKPELINTIGIEFLTKE
jgi:pimeloyl-ACP methyl ester carboxylesterase